MNRVISSKQFGSALPELAEGAAVPTDIQWMPPGKHTITALHNGKSVTLTVQVDAKTAERMQALLQDLRSKAAAGQEDLPYIDFNHDDNKAAAYITAFRWAGDDPATGGVRATVEWTGSGKAALQGRDYRRFSPSFIPNATGEIIGAPLNMGGLVNRAAFKNINPIVAGGPGTTERNPTMDQNEKQAADLVAAQQKIIDLTTQLARANATINAKDGEITSLKGKISTLETAQTEQIRVDAKAAVATAVAEGKIPPQDKDLQAHYEAMFVANPAAGRAILAKLPAPTALNGQVIQGQGHGGAAKPLSPADVWNAAFKAKEAAAAKN